jgi:hypothetical protein
VAKRLFTASVVFLAAGFPAREAGAVRFTLGVESSFVPIVIDPSPGAAGSLRLGLRPVLDIEASPYFAIGVYTPFTLIRGGESASTGAESIFAVGVSLRHPIVRSVAPEEILLYGTLRGGFGTADGRAGAFAGVALGGAMTWLETGRGLFAELSAGHVGISAARSFPEVDRWLIGVSIGVVFRLGGEAWRVGDDG